MKKKSIIILATFFFSVFTASAQLVIKNDGRVIVGPDTRPDDDMYRVLSMSIQGRLGEFNAGSKLAFGDFGRYDHNGWNVFIGEFGTYDSDILWLHGKKGVKMSAFNGDYIVAEWNYNGQRNYLPRFTIYDGVRLDRLSVSSDDNHKSSIRNIQYALPRLMRLNGVTYNYKPLDNIQPVGNVGEIERAEGLTEKEDLARQLATSALQSRGFGDTRYGLITSEIIDLFPEIVEFDSLGNQYVNYLEMIPIIVSAFRELYTAIENRGVSLDLIEDYEDYLRGMQSDSTVDHESRAHRSTNSNSSITNGAVLYQNSPNPFTSATTIEYFIPTDATSANILVFNLTGELMQSYPIHAFGNGQVVISGSTLNAGMYIYSLVVDEQIVGTKRMVLTK